MKKLISLFIAFSTMLVLLCSWTVTASAKTTPAYKIVDINSSKVITNRSDYYDVVGGKKIKFHLGYSIGGAVINIDTNSKQLFSQAYDVKKAAEIIQKNVIFAYTIRDNNNKIIASGSAKYGDTIKVPGNSLQKRRVYITSQLLNDGSNINVNNNSKQYAKSTNAVLAATNGRYCIEY